MDPSLALSASALLLAAGLLPYAPSQPAVDTVGSESGAGSDDDSSPAFAQLLSALCEVISVSTERLETMGQLCGVAVDAFALSVPSGLASLSSHNHLTELNKPSSQSHKNSAAVEKAYGDSSTSGSGSGGDRSIPQVWALIQQLLIKLLDPTDPSSSTGAANNTDSSNTVSASAAIASTSGSSDVQKELRLKLQLKLIRCLGSDVLSASLRSGHAPTQAALLELLARGARQGMSNATGTTGGEGKVSRVSSEVEQVERSTLSKACVAALFTVCQTPTSTLTGIAKPSSDTRDTRDLRAKNDRLGSLEQRQNQHHTVIDLSGQQDVKLQEQTYACPPVISAKAAPLLLNICKEILSQGEGVAENEQIKFVLEKLLMLRLHPQVSRRLREQQGLANQASQMVGVRSHLCLLYYELCELITVPDDSIRKLVCHCLKLAGEELGIQKR